MDSKENYINFSRRVIETFMAAKLSVETDFSASGIELDAVLFMNGFDDAGPSIGVEIVTRSTSNLVSIASALDRLVVARSRRAINGGLIVVQEELPDKFLQALHFYDGSRLTSSSPFTIEGFASLQHSLRSGAFRREWELRFADSVVEESASASFGAAATTTRRKLFVCMEFNDHFDDVFNYGITPVADRLGFIARRVKDHPGTSTIIADIQANLRSADIVLCDVSTNNVNVLYEVGYSHAIAKPTILTAAIGTPLPFNTRGYRHLLYRNISDLELQLEAEIRGLVAGRQL